MPANTRSRSTDWMIGALARRAGVEIETIRYYERIGLLAPPPRTKGGHRVYGPTHLQRLRFVRRCREFGFSLDDVRLLLRLAEDARDPCAGVRVLAAERLAQVRARIEQLRTTEAVLTEAVGRCERNEQLGCPLVKALSTDPPA